MKAKIKNVTYWSARALNNKTYLMIVCDRLFNDEWTSDGLLIDVHSKANELIARKGLDFFNKTKTFIVDLDTDTPFMSDACTWEIITDIKEDTLC